MIHACEYNAQSVDVCMCATSSSVNGVLSFRAHVLVALVAGLRNEGARAQVKKGIRAAGVLQSSEPGTEDDTEHKI